jgi:hypothetical protein
VQFGLHIVVVEVVEHVLHIFEGFLVALISPLTHDVCYLRDCVF